MHDSPVSHRHRLLCFSLLIPLLLGASAARAAEIRWTGALSTSWSDAANWDGGVVPGKDDLVIVPLTASQPAIGSVNTLCAGVVLETGATLSTIGGTGTLYIIGPGDLDGDGVSDLTERDLSEAMLNYDADGDQIPNFAETDSDNDGMSDACEFEYMDELPAAFNPYEFRDPEIDSDSDGFSDGVECADGSDPTDPDSRPVLMSLYGYLGLTMLCLILMALSVWILRKSGPRTRGILSVLLATTLLLLGGHMEATPLQAASLTVRFAIGETIEGVALAASDNDTLLIKGNSVRPWSGQSNYLIRPLTIQAKHGTVYLGGMRTTLDVGVLGQGSLEAASAYQSTSHPSPVFERLPAGSRAISVFRGEKLALIAEPDTGWGFHRWSGGDTSSTNPLTFQVSTDGLRVLAMFGPPGPDLTLVGYEPSDEVNSIFANIVGSMGEVYIENIGQSSTMESNWTDGLYLSRDATFDDADFEMGTTVHSGVVAAGASYATDIAFTIPDVAPGRYYCLLVVDVSNEVTDVNRSNNVAAISLAVLDINLAQ